MSLSELNQFQRNLSNDDESKRRYVNDENGSEYSSSENDADENGPTIKIIPPKPKGDNTFIINQLCLQQKSLIRAEKKICKLKNDISKEEVENRYARLEL